MTKCTRRQILASSGATTASVVGLSDCVGESDSGSRNAEETNSTAATSSMDQLTVAYVPIYPNMQHYIMQEEGYTNRSPRR